MVEDAVVLAGGFGSRLRSIVSELPKCLAPVSGRPFLHYQLNLLERAGLRHVILATGHKGELVEAAIGSRYGKITIGYSQETTPLGTGGALWKALAQCRGESTLVLNGDTYIDLDFSSMLEEADYDVLVAVVSVADCARFGSVRVEGRRIVSFQEKGLSGPGLINSGTYLVRRDLRTRLPRTGAFSFERDILEAELPHLKIAAFVSDSQIIDIGTPEDFKRAQALLPTWANQPFT
jgi:D-glycero-alpha-D-manno-heptose 1-phosphate guanylyltransferase